MVLTLMLMAWNMEYGMVQGRVYSWNIIEGYNHGTSSEETIKEHHRIEQSRYIMETSSEEHIKAYIVSSSSSRGSSINDQVT